MPSIIECPTCGKKLTLADELVGRQVKCAECAGTFVAEKLNAPPPRRDPAAERDRELDRDDDDDDRPYRRRGRRTFQEAHRGPMILVFGILAIVLGGIGLVTGILAWVFGKQDLKKMDAGVMDPEGRSMTQIGWILGIVGVCFHALGLVVACLYFVFIMVFFTAAVSSMPTGPVMTPSAPPPPPKAPRPAKKNLNLFVPMGLPDFLPQRLR